MNDVFDFYLPPDSFGRGDAAFLIARVPVGVGDEQALLRTLGRLLRFPPYYGGNLDAFWDCVSVLDGVTARRVAVVHAALPLPPGPRLAAYLETLADAVRHWRTPSAARCFEVWFPEGARREVAACFPPRQ